jgi:hypothetical protein
LCIISHDRSMAVCSPQFQRRLAACEAVSDQVMDPQK